MTDTTTELPLFELIAPDGNTLRIFGSGRCDGFPEGTLIINHARPLLDALRCSAQKQIGSPSVTAEQP